MRKNLTHILFSVFFCINIVGFAQQDLTIQNMQIVPQSNYNNPANIPTPKVYMSFPGLPSIYLGVSHSGFAYKDLVKRRADDSLTIDLDNAIATMAKSNFLSVNMNMEVFSFGFKLLKKNYINFSVSEKAAVRFAYPRDLIKLAWKGNGAFLGEAADFSGIGLNATTYLEFAMGYSRIINNKLTVGIRPKYIFGQANVYTNRSDLSIFTNASDYALTANANILINSSLDSNVYAKNKSKDVNPKDMIMNKDNKGMGIDLGAQYSITPKLQVAASIVDLGKITWKTCPRNFQSNNASFNFSGIDLNDFISTKDSTTKNGFEKIMDSLSNTFKITETNSSYKTNLGTKIYLSGVYNLTKHDKAGILFRGELFNNTIHPAYTLSYSHMFGNMLNLTASYSILNRSYSNVGFGMALNLGFWQIYLTTDNAWGAMYPTTIKNVIFHFGMNFIFGYKPKKDNEDIPKMNN